MVVVVVAVIVVVVVAEQKKEEKDTQNTQNKKKQRMKTDKKKIADYWPFLALFQGKELCFVLCGKKFFSYDPFLSVLPHVWRSRIRAYQNYFTT